MGADRLLSLDDRVVQVLPDHVPAEAWELEPDDLVKGFLGLPFAAPEGTRHTYDNSTTFILARMVERVTGRGLPEFLDERLFKPMGVDRAEWDRVKSGNAFGFHGLHLTTEAIAAFGELLLRGDRCGDQQLVPRDWVQLATRRHIDCVPFKDGGDDADFSCGYGYQFWMSRHGYHGHGSFGQQCVVVPSHDLVVAVTAQGESQEVFDAMRECLLPGVDHTESVQDDEILAGRLQQLSLSPVPGSADPGRSASARLDASAEGSALPDGTTVIIDPTEGGWLVRFGSLLDVAVGHGDRRESSPLRRPLVAAGAWEGSTFVADLYVVTTPHRVRLVVDAEARTAAATWSTVPLTGPSLELHVRSPLMTRPDVA